MGENYPIWQITFKDDITFNGETYKTSGAVIEFADTMKESYPDPESRQRKTEPGTLEEDIKRRDLSINMLIKDMTTGEVKDMTGISKTDIENGIIRGHPAVSLDDMFNNDPLRMLRVIRFQAKYGWDIPLSVLHAIKRNADRIKIVSAERIMEELKKVMEYGKLHGAIKLMSMTGLLKFILPEIEALKGMQHNKKYHQEGDIYKHTLMVLKNAPAGVENQIAALLHDIGKPSTTELVEDQIHNIGHENVGADIAEAILHRLKFDNDTVARVKKMVRNHMRPHALGRASGPKALRKFIRDVGEEMVDSILSLAEADELGKIPATHDIPDLRKKIDDVKKQTVPIKKEPVLNGTEIMDILKIKPGAGVGEAKKFLIDLEDDYVEQGKELTKEEAKAKLLEKYGKKTSISTCLRILAEDILNPT
jgi:poly(A) polymerase